MRRKKTLKGKKHLHQRGPEVFICMRKKKEESVSSAWTQDGVIKHRHVTFI